MTATTLISSRDPVDGDQLVHQIARDLAKGGTDVTLFLVDNGVFLARNGVLDALRAELREAGVTVLADSFALAERGIGSEAIAEGVEATGLETLVDHMAEGRKVAWH